MKTGKLNVLIVTYTPSPYQVELFNTIAQSTEVNIKVAYLFTREKGRLWKLLPFEHDYILLNDAPEKYTLLQKWADSSDLIVFNYYQHPHILSLLNQTAKSEKAWCFWGERPGYHRFGLLGVFYRKWRLRALLKSKAPVWGIGKWAIEQYRLEFGHDREYCNLPYYSNLNRFRPTSIRPINLDNKINFIYSGALIQRKGVDILAAAFSKLADKNPDVRLTFMGMGPLENALKDQLSKHKEKVNFLGFQNWIDLPNYYQQADILCVPSRYDGWGLIVPEGLAAGLPVIATDHVGAAVEFIETDKNGWLIPANHVDSFYQAMQKATELEEHSLQEYSFNAQQSIKDHYLADGAQNFIGCVHAAFTGWDRVYKN